MKLHIFLSLSICLTLFLQVNAQEQRTVQDRADEAYARLEFNRAAVLLTQLVDQNKATIQVLEKLAESYAQMKQYELASTWYRQVIDHAESKPHHWIKYGQQLQAKQDYVGAKNAFNNYVQKTNDQATVQLWLDGCDSALYWMDRPTPHSLQNESSINTSQSEFGTFYDSKGLYLVSETAKGQSYAWTGNPFLQVQLATTGTNARWELPLKSVQSSQRFHIGPMIQSKDGKRRFFTQTHNGSLGIKTKDQGQNFKTFALELYISELNENGDWSSVPFPYNDVSTYSVGHAALSVDEQILYFVSDRPGGYGDTDIWYCVLLEDGTWSMPRNAGSQINTAGAERFPTIHSDGTLYFSSDGRPGMGGLDLFKAVGQADEWSTPMNLGFPMNSGGDDFLYIQSLQAMDGSTGYLSSNRMGGLGMDDIYHLRVIPPAVVNLTLEVRVFNKADSSLLPDAEITIMDQKHQPIVRAFSSMSGGSKFEVTPSQEYFVKSSKVKFHSDSIKMYVKEDPQSTNLQVSLYLEPIYQVGKSFVLEDLFYDFDQYTIRPDAALILDELVQTLAANPTLYIELSSHTDARGSDTYNLTLSQRRAQAAVDYMVSQGIARERMTPKGYGETQLRNACANGVTCTEEEHQQNRRTEIKILAFD
jgi:outer membrane protein OmpA-like peptidoglycan-associated protein/tetratricopeptide (TPR) repeat protein